MSTARSSSDGLSKSHARRTAFRPVTLLSHHPTGTGRKTPEKTGNEIQRHLIAWFGIALRHQHFGDWAHCAPYGLGNRRSILLSYEANRTYGIAMLT
jgi:hypothetical protein